MHPILFRIGSFEIRTWGVLVLTALLVGIFWVAREAKRNGYNPDDIIDIGTWVIIMGIVGARVFYVLYHPSEFSDNPLLAFAVWRGGMVFFGGFLFALVTGIILIKKKGLPLWQVADWTAPAFALGMFIGRWGCFFNGCCYGRPTNSVFGVSFKPGSPAFAEYGPMKLHPTQLYESFGNLIIFFILLLVRKKYRLHDGALFGLYMILGPMVRFIDDFFRAYDKGAYLFGLPLTVNQWISIGLMIFGAWLLFFKEDTQTEQ